MYKVQETRTVAGDEERVEGGGTAKMKEKANNVGEQIGGDREEEVETGATHEEEEKEARDGEPTEERQLNEMARKLGLMTDEEFEALLEGTQRIGQEAAEMAEGLDLASPVEGREIEREPASEPANVVSEKEAPKTSRRKLTLKDDPKAEGPKLMRTSKRCLGRELKEKEGAGVVSEVVEVSSEEEDAPRDKMKSTTIAVGQGEEDSPTKPGENPQFAAPISDAPGDAEHPSSGPTGQGGMDPPTKPEEIPTPSPSQPVEEMNVDGQQADPTAQEEASVEGQEGDKSEDDEESYQLERKRKGKAPAKKKQDSKKPRIAQTAVVIREPEQPSQQLEKLNSDEDYTSEEE